MVVISRVSLEVVFTAMGLTGRGESGFSKLEAGGAAAGRGVVFGFQPMMYPLRV